MCPGIDLPLREFYEDIRKTVWRGEENIISEVGLSYKKFGFFNVTVRLSKSSLKFSN
ncbi:MAG: hypothetical protein LH472_11300 [Pyrinomonadaceae bacterium]|nr:hypothetical protein [Pyrinomonadaceae bacterium]